MIMKSVRLTSRLVPDCTDEVDNFPPLARFDVNFGTYGEVFENPVIEPHEEKA
jgi:hypothetical protein